MARQESNQRKRENDYYKRQLRRNQIIFTVLAAVLILSLVLSLVVSL
jgi:hypothetical protein